MREKAVILFDLDNTLLNFDIAEQIALKGVMLSMDIDPTDEVMEDYHRINNLQWEMLERGEKLRSQILVDRFDILAKKHGLTIDPFMAQDKYEKLLAQGHYFIDGAPELLENLYNIYDLYIVSNGTAFVQDGRIKSAGIAKYFKGIFISELMGADKPQKEYFDLCFAQIPDFDRSRTVIVGDSLTSDIKGGINSGIKTCWFNPRHKPAENGIPADIEVDSLEKVPNALKILLK